MLTESKKGVKSKKGKKGVRPHLIKWGLTPFLILTLTACSGWRLRGSDPNTLLTQSIYLSGQPSETYSLVQEQLQKKQKLAALTSADLQLTLNNEQWQRRTASRTSSAQTAEYEITLTVNYRVQTISGELVPSPGEVRISRTYTFDQNDIAGKDKEEQLLRRDIRRAAARQILQQLQFIQR